MELRRGFAVAKGLAFTIGLTVIAPTILADQPGGDPQKVAYRPQPKVGFTPSNAEGFLFSAPPREDEQAANQIYGPIAEYLSKVLGRTVTYQHAGNWGAYQGMMQKGAYDIVFDGPHFNSWRVEKAEHTVLVKVPGDHVFLLLVRKGNDKIKETKQLAGRTVCAHAPPNLGTLTVLNLFDNPSRQPIIVNIEGWDTIYQGLMDNKCVAAIVTQKAYTKLETVPGAATKALYRSDAMPDNAFSASSRLTIAEQQKIAAALLSPDGERATEALRQKYANGKRLVATSNKEFIGYSVYLKNEWGY